MSILKFFGTDFYDNVDCVNFMELFGRETIAKNNGGTQYEGKMYYFLDEYIQTRLTELLSLPDGEKPEIAYIHNGKTSETGNTIYSEHGRFSLLTIDNSLKIKAIMNNKGGHTFISNRGKTVGWDTYGYSHIFVNKQ